MLQRINYEIRNLNKIHSNWIYSKLIGVMELNIISETYAAAFALSIGIISQKFVIIRIIIEPEKLSNLSCEPPFIAVSLS